MDYSSYLRMAAAMVVVSFFIVASGCELLGISSPSGGSDLREVAEDSPFEIEVGEEVVLTELNISIRFVELEEDSRCPLGVDCFWQGRVRTIFELLDRNEGYPFVIEGFIGGSSADEGLPVAVRDFRIEMKALAPYPVYDPDTGRSTSGRVALLEVERISGR